MKKLLTIMMLLAVCSSLYAYPADKEEKVRKTRKKAERVKLEDELRSVGNGGPKTKSYRSIENRNWNE